MNKWIFYFSDPFPQENVDLENILGGKGASLKKMTLAGLKVPPGFTISTRACYEYFLHNRKWPNGLEEELYENMVRLERDTGKRYGAGNTPLLVSVRSGAQISMPGMMDTILNCGLHPGLSYLPNFDIIYRQFIAMFVKSVAGIELPLEEKSWHKYIEIYERTTHKKFPVEPWECLRECINAVFNSWNSERAIAYRRRHGIEGLLGTAVNIQAMFPSEISGILFTQNPNNIHLGQMIIEANYGLGESVVSGEIIPDRFIVSRDNLEIIDVIAGRKSHVVFAMGNETEFDNDKVCLEKEQIKNLCRLCLEVERYFGIPMDIEWGYSKGEFALLQCRPIKNIEIIAEIEKIKKEEISRLKLLAHNKNKVWITHNLRETLKFPTPLSWDIIKKFMSGQGGFVKMYMDLGYRPSRRVYEEGFLELIFGRIYADPDLLAELFWADLPLNYDIEEIKKNPAILNQAPTKFDPERIDEKFFIKLPSLIYAMWKSRRLIKRIKRNIKERFEEEILPSYLDYINLKRNQDLSKLSFTELIDELHHRIYTVLYDFGAESLKPGFFGGIALNNLENIFKQLLGDSKGREMAYTLTMNIEEDITFKQDQLLYKIALGERNMREFIDKFGHRAVNEMELMEMRWREDQTYLNRIIEQIRKGHINIEEKYLHNIEKQRLAMVKLPDILAEAGASCMLESINSMIKEARSLLPYREIGKYYLMMGYELIRINILEIGRRSGLGDDVFFLYLDELSDIDLYADRIKFRKLRWEAFKRVEVPDVIDSDNLELLGKDLPLPEGVKILKGTPVAPGVATGRAVIVFEPDPLLDLGRDYILVCPSTDPGWTPLFINAVGLVVERGGVLSHGAIVARDFGIPAIICPDATRLVKAGQLIRIDGSQGRIQVLSENENT